MLSRALALAAVLSLGAASALADDLDKLIGERMARSHIPAVALAVVDHGKVVRLQAYGSANLDWNIKADPDTAFQLASATKLFTGVALMRLVEQGRLSLDDPIAKFFDGAPPEWSRITVRQLATHTSGLSEDIGQPRPQTVEGVVAAAMKTPLAYAPGTEARYGFTDFVVLRAVMEKASGLSLPDLFQREIISPLGLTHTGFTHTRQEGSIRSADVFPKRASIYAFKGGEQRASDFLYGETGYGAGGLYASARDMATLFAALDGGRLLKPESYRALITPPTLPDGRSGGFGVGWTSGVYLGQPVVGHSGGPALADVMHVPGRDLTIIVLTNQQRFYPLLAQDVADALLPPAPPPRPLPQTSPKTAALLLQILGDAGAGKIDAGQFAGPSGQGAAAFLGDFGQPLLLAVGAPKAAELLAESADGGLVSRRYLVTFAHKTMRWLITTDAEGRITVLRPIGEGE